MILKNFCSLFIFICTVLGSCDSYSPAFPLPQLSSDDVEIKKAHDAIKLALSEAFAGDEFDTTSFSIEVTSSTDQLFEFHRTAPQQDQSRPGAKIVDGTSCYRIASITKPFTVLAILQQQIAGRLQLDDPVNKYLPDLGEKSKGGIPWKDISIRTLASQLSGIPRDMAQQDVLYSVGNPTHYGLPPASSHGMLKCDSFTNYTIPCSASDLLERLDGGEPIFPPKQQSTYSNMNYELLGLVLQNITGMDYEEYIVKNVLKELNMSSSSFSKPGDSNAVLPKGESYYWDVEMGIQKPTGGLYSSSADLGKFIRYVLTHYNGLTPALNWLNPISYATGLNTFYGLPWEIFRTNQLFGYTSRPVTFVMKSGGLPGYGSLMVAIPEYGIGFDILVAGNMSLLIKAAGVIGQQIVQAAEMIAQRQVKEKHVGHFAASSKLQLNSSITISHSPAKGLYISSWISNSTDALEGYRQLPLTLSAPGLIGVRLQLVPTLLFKDEKNQNGEIWRILPVNEQPNSGALDEFCLTDIDYASYGGLPLNEVVFWDQDKNAVWQNFELTAYRVKLNKQSSQSTTVEAEQPRILNPTHGQSVIANAIRGLRRD